MRGVATLLFFFGMLLLIALSVLILSGDEAIIAQIGLGVWSLGCFLAAIYLRVAEVARYLTKADTTDSKPLES